MMGRRNYIISRVLQMIPTIAILLVLIFLMIRVIPGDPAVTLLGIEATPERVEELRRHLGLDQPWPVQFWLFFKNLVFHGDLGMSTVARVPVADLVKQRLPLTLTLVAYSMFLSLVVTIPLAVLAALKRDTILDHIVRGFTVLFISTPGFWVGIMLLILLGVKFPLFPVGGAGETFFGRLYHLFLPALTMSMLVTAVLTRNLRDSILTIMNSEYVTVARSKGLREKIVVVRHVLRNALISTVTLFGLYTGWLVGGSVIIESVFALPGMGSMMVTAILGRDYQVVQGFTLVYAVLVSVVYLLTDITYSFVDPRISL
jgi:peptide/nickel transport system permease protein